MSRIEKSLEKAMEMQGSAVKEGPSGASGKTEVNVTAVYRPEGGQLIRPEDVDHGIVCIREPGSPIAEQYRKLRARILKSTKTGEFLNTIMVASAGEGEGKTVTAINLAVTIANEIDLTVLLVDTDLRNPSVHKYLGLRSGPGLSEYLKGEVAIPDAMVKTGIGKLMVLPAGSVPENPSELLSSARMRSLVGELKNRYQDRYIILDSPPLLSVADSIPLAGYVDGVLMVVRAASTKSRAASRALSLIKGSHILGVVFNDVPELMAKQAFSGTASAKYFYGKNTRSAADR